MSNNNILVIGIAGGTGKRKVDTYKTACKSLGESDYCA